MAVPLPFEGFASPIDGRQYHPFMREGIEQALRRIWVSMFIFDIRPSRDLQGMVLDLLSSLVHRQRVGVDVRVLLGSTTRTADIEIANLATGYLLNDRGVPIRRMFAETVDAGSPRPARLGSHAKFVVIDDVAVVGSQNWTDDAFRLNVEDAVVIRGGATTLLANEFLRIWQHGRGLPKDVP